MWSSKKRQVGPRHPATHSIAQMSAQAWWAMLKHLVGRREKKYKREDRIKSYLYVVAAFCQQSASKDFLPCPLSPCQIVIEPSWKSKKPSPLSLWHQHPFFVSLAVTQTYMHISSWKEKKNVCCYLGALSKLSRIQPPLISPLTDFIIKAMRECRRVETARKRITWIWLLKDDPSYLLVAM